MHSPRVLHPRRTGWLLALVLVTLAVRPGGAQQPRTLTLSVVGTNDVHGYVFEQRGRGGLEILGGYLRNLRAARAADGGAVLLLDAGDTYQGGIESDISEGALVIDAYNALGYTAAAIGNHDFEFGTAEPPDAGGVPGDPRGALKARARQAHFPMLAANLIDTATGRLVDWPNVSPSVLIEVNGIKVGIVGVMTMEALQSTLAANVLGLRMAPIGDAIRDQATALRARGAEVVVVTAHAGGRCTRFGAPDDLSSCDRGSEIFEAARQMPPGLVDAIVAGHTHAGLAHEVNGIPIVEAMSLGQYFSRVDLTIDATTHRRVASRPFAPQELCAEVTTGSTGCSGDDERPGGARVTAQYEGRPVVRDAEVRRAMTPVLDEVRAQRSVPLGPVLETTLDRAGDTESPLGNLFVDAIRDAFPGADAAVNNNGRGGLRADLSPGPLTYGALYDVFPFDNRLVELTLRGEDLRRVFEDQVREGARGGLGISGLRVRARCTDGSLSVLLMRESGQPVRPDEMLRVVTTDQLASRGIFGIFPSPESVRHEAPIAREVVERWMRTRGGALRASQFMDGQRPRWDLPAATDTACLMTQ